MKEVEFRKELKEIIYSNEWLMQVLRNVQEVNLPDWFVTAGTIRSIVWDSLHDHNSNTSISDIDVIYYDPENLSSNCEKRVEYDLSLLMSNVKWDVKNQAAVHLWFEEVFGYKTTPIKSCEDAIKRWNSTSIGIRLEKNDKIFILAPYGLTDLFEMKMRRNSLHIPKDLFLRKVKERRIEEKWPKVQIIED